MKYTDEHITLEVFCQYADTGIRLPEKVVGTQTIVVAKPGNDFNVCVIAAGACFNGNEWDKIEATCSVGGEGCGEAYSLYPGQKIAFKGWRTHKGGKAFRVSQITPEEGEEGQDGFECMNRVDVEIYKAQVVKFEGMGWGEMVRRKHAKFLPEYRLKVSNVDTKKFYHRPSLSCVEGSSFEAQPISMRSYRVGPMLATLSAVLETDGIADLRQREFERRMHPPCTSYKTKRMSSSLQEDVIVLE